jgi:hypothetical protein
LQRERKGKMVHNSIQLTIFLCCSLIHAVLTNIYVSKYAALNETGAVMCIILRLFDCSAGESIKISMYYMYNAIGPLMLLWCKIFWYIHSRFLHFSHAKMCRVFVNCGMFAGLPFYSHCVCVCVCVCSNSQYAIPECKNATTFPHTLFAFDRFNAILILILPATHRVIIPKWYVYRKKITHFCGSILWFKLLALHAYGKSWEGGGNGNFLFTNLINFFPSPFIVDELIAR